MFEELDFQLLFLVLCSMGIRDIEIARIEKYAAGLGIKILWKQYKKANGGAEAEWTEGGHEITMYTWARQSKTSQILALVHELAHHMSWIYADRKDNPQVIAALQADGEHKKGTPPIDKELRYLIWHMEHHDAKYQDGVFRELNLKIPRYKFLATRRVDLWYYRQFYITGKKPMVKVLKVMHRHFEAQYRRRYVRAKNQA
jgi:hypothetical protein